MNNILFELPEKVKDISDFNGVPYADETKNIINNFDSIKNSLNKNIDKLIKLLNIIEKWFKVNTKYIEDSINLKLYDIHYKIKNDWEYEKFNFFCDEQYENFCEMLKNKGLKEEHIGRTSSFRIVSDDGFKVNSQEYDNHNNLINLRIDLKSKNPEQFKNDLLQIFYDTDDVIDEIDDYNILYLWDFDIESIKKHLNNITKEDVEEEYKEFTESDHEEYIEESDLLSEIKFIRSLIIVFNCLNDNLINYLKEMKIRIKNINNAYKDVKEFKDNQLVIWESWLEYYFESIEIEHDEQKEVIPETHTIKIDNCILMTTNPKKKNLLELRKEIFDIINTETSFPEIYDRIIKLDSNYKISSYDIYSVNDINAEKNTLTFT